MKISTVLDHIDSGHIALPEFQRGYVWSRDQVRGLFDSLYQRHPVGGLLVWVTESKTAVYRGDSPLVAGVVKLLLDGQQRMTSLYGVARGQPPKFFDGNVKAFTDLYFNLATETFAFYQPIKMKGEPFWVDVTQLLKNGFEGLGELLQTPALMPYIKRLSRLLSIMDIELHIEEITGTDKTLEVVVDIFNRVNSGGTKLSKGDLALARICADWPEARDTMKAKIRKWAEAGYSFSLDWLLRSVNTVLTGEAKFQFLQDKSAEHIQQALDRASRQIDACLNMISGRLGLDHDRVLFGRFAIPVMVRYLDQHPGQLSEKERDKLLFWFVQAGMRGRFSGSTESYIDKDLAAISGEDSGLDTLLEQLRLWRGSLRVEPGHFTGWSLGDRFYPILYLITRIGEARDWGTGLALKATLLGRMNQLEVHHIFPKSQLYKRKHQRPEVNALANFCFQTKETNLNISNRLPQDYFPEIEARNPGALASQWIPAAPELWKIEHYGAFLEARKALLAAETNRWLTELLHGDTRWLAGSAAAVSPTPPGLGGISSEDEETALAALNIWVSARGLAPGIVSYAFAHQETGEQRAVFDLAWPNGVQEALSQPVVLLLNEPAETLVLANQAGFRCFTTTDDFRAYVNREILAETEANA